MPTRWEPPTTSHPPHTHFTPTSNHHRLTTPHTAARPFTLPQPSCSPPRTPSQVHRIGAQHSSYVTAAKLAGCHVREGRSPKAWRFKSAASWLHGKILTQMRGEAHRSRGASAGGNAATGAMDLMCESSLGPLINGTPCASPCLVTCREMIQRAYA
jgi:hypothetical protein